MLARDVQEKAAQRLLGDADAVSSYPDDDEEFWANDMELHIYGTH